MALAFIHPFSPHTFPVLSGRIRIPYFMSSDCEHLIRKMLTVDPRRRPTIDQIKQHRWMRFGQYAAKYGQQSQQLQQQQTTAMANQQQQQQEPNGQQPPPEPHPQILRLMNNIGIESHKVRTVRRYLQHY
jgi:serine/threonine protein kinase